MYSRYDLLVLRFVSHHRLDPAKLQLLKIHGILRYRGKRAGQRRQKPRNITVLITNRLFFLQRARSSEDSRILVRIPLSPPADLTGCYTGCPLKLCTLNAQSLKNKTADFTNYVCTSGADIFALTETWETLMLLTKLKQLHLVSSL